MAATTPPPTTTGGQLPYWGMYMNQANISPEQVNNNPYASQFLTALHQYDPNAAFQFNQDPNGGTGSYSLQYDASKLPKVPGSDQNPGDYAGMYWRPQDSTTFAENQAHPMYGGNNRVQLYNNSPSAFSTDSTYGRTTPSSNVKPDQGTWLDWAGPLAVAAFAMGAPTIFGTAGTDGLTGGLLESGGTTAGDGAATTAAGDTSATTAGDTAATTAGDTGTTVGSANIGYGTNPADEVGALPGYGAAALPADAGSIATSNWLVAHGLPAWWGGSAGAVGGELATLGGGAGLLHTASQVVNALGKVPGIGTTPGGTGGGTPLLLGGGGGGGTAVAPDSLAMLRAFYAPKTAAHMSQLPVATSPMAAMLQQPGGIQNLLGQLMQGGGYG